MQYRTFSLQKLLNTPSYMQLVQSKLMQKKKKIPQNECVPHSCSSNMLCHVIKTIKLEFVGSQLFSKGVCPNGFRVRVRARLDLFSLSLSSLHFLLYLICHHCCH